VDQETATAKVGVLRYQDGSPEAVLIQPTLSSTNPLKLYFYAVNFWYIHASIPKPHSLPIYIYLDLTPNGTGILPYIHYNSSFNLSLL